MVAGVVLVGMRVVVIGGVTVVVGMGVVVRNRCSLGSLACK